jgi:hypothetical protein
MPQVFPCIIRSLYLAYLFTNRFHFVALTLVDGAQPICDSPLLWWFRAKVLMILKPQGKDIVCDSHTSCQECVFLTLDIDLH